MPRLNDLRRSLLALEQESTLIAVIELSQSSWLVAGIVSRASCGIARNRFAHLAVEPETASRIRRTVAGAWRRRSQSFDQSLPSIKCCRSPPERLGAHWLPFRRVGGAPTLAKSLEGMLLSCQHIHMWARAHANSRRR